MELCPCPIFTDSQGLQALNRCLNVEFRHTAECDMEEKVDMVLAANGFTKLSFGVYRHKNGRDVAICRLGPSIRLVWRD